MYIEENIVLTRSDPSGGGGTQFLYRVNNYGLAVITRPEEDISQIHWEVDVIKYDDEKNFRFEVCHTTELADKTLKFRNDQSLNEFLLKAFDYLKELDYLEQILPEEERSE